MADGCWIDEITGSIKTGFTNYIRTPLDELTNGFMPYNDQTIETYTGTMTDLVENYISSAGEIDMQALALKNPNDIPIKYYSLVLSNLHLYFRARIMMGEGNDGHGNFTRVFPYVPEERNFSFKLKIYDASNNLVKTAYSRLETTSRDSRTVKKSYFDILGLLDGQYTFKVYHLNDIEIYSKETYVWNNREIDIIIDEAAFIPKVVSGAITWNGTIPINDVHVRVANIDHKEMYYGSTMNGWHSPEYSSTVNTYGLEMKYHQNSISSIYYSERPYPWTTNGESLNEVDVYGGGRTCYGPKSYHKYGEYRLYDLVPGEYKIDYFVMPDLNTSNSEWPLNGDSYYYYDITTGLSSIIDDTHELYVPISAIQWKGDNEWTRQKYLRDEYSDYQDWEPMDVMVFFEITYDKLKTYSYDEDTQAVTGSTIKYLNRRSLMFSSVREGDYFKISLSSDFTNFGLDSSSLTYFNYNDIRVLFGEKVGTQTVNITNSTTVLPIVDISRMYSKYVILKGYDYSIDRSPYNSYRKARLLSGMSELSNTSYSYSKPYYSEDYTIYGVEAGKSYQASYDVDLGSSYRNLATSSFLCDSTYETVDLHARQLSSLTLTVKDRALMNNSEPGYIQRYAVAWIYFDVPAISAYQYSSYSGTDNSGYSYTSVDTYARFEFSGLFDESYSIGVCLSSINASDGYEYKYYQFTGSSLTSGLVENHMMLTDHDNVVAEIPYQPLKVKLKGFNMKTNQEENPISTLSMTRSQNDGADESYTVAYHNGYGSGYDAIIRSGAYSSISYQTTREDGTSFVIYYQPMIIGIDKTFTLYSQISLAANVRIYMKENGTAKANTSFCIYDDNKNLYWEFTTNASGYADGINIPYIPFYIKVKTSSIFSTSTVKFLENRSYSYEMTTGVISLIE